MTRHKRKVHAKKIVPLFVILGAAVIGYTAIINSKAATFAVASQAEAGSLTTKAATVSDATASGGSAVKFGSTTTGGGGICTNPIGSVQNRDQMSIPGSPIVVRNEAWNDLHGPQTTYACNEQSWYSLSNQPDNGGAVETYPDSLLVVGGKTINQYNSITSTFAEQYQNQGNWDAGYDIWCNDFDANTEVMIWNEWVGGQGYWPTLAKTAVTIGGVPYHFYKNGTELMLFRDTQVKSGSVDILAAEKWMLANGYLKTTDVITDIEYGVEISATVGTQRFDNTGFTVSIN